ncbi:uncharacterized protein PRCAT00001430001 [Priceomyces carsonii]|uniref:uncharacterized protein n=1 Tax=Priceomyces carsonii TaxID=28549 RepID=UPI002EDB7A53|nr:unnamed protein product [Priceomyces carsonii]
MTASVTSDDPEDTEADITSHGLTQNEDLFVNQGLLKKRDRFKKQMGPRSSYYALPSHNSKGLFSRNIQNSKIRGLNDLKDPLRQAPFSVTVSALEALHRLFPEFMFIHPTSLIYEEYLDPCLRNSIMAVICFFAPHSLETWIDPSSEMVKEDYCYNYAIQNLIRPQLMLRDPTIEKVQCLLMLSLYDWSRCRYYSSWMLHGMASRILQEFSHVVKCPISAIDSSSENQANKTSLLYREKLVRTYWSCFMLDRVLASGRNRCSAFVHQEFERIMLPCDDTDFIYMTEFAVESVHLNIITLGNYLQIKGLPSQNRSPSYLVRIFELWGDISDFILQGGRTKFLIPPWEPSSFFAQSKAKLKEWYHCLPTRWRWSSDNLKAHRAFNTDVSFIMINSIFNLCLIYIHREYTPFLPHSNDYPVGPTEEPLLPLPPSKDFWITSAIELFSSTRTLSSILIEASEYDQARNVTTIVSPILLFCVFSACATAIYGSTFHWMDPQHDSYLGINSLTTSAVKLLECLKSMQDTLDITSYWYSIARQLVDLYTLVADDRKRASELKLGKFTFRELEDSIQIVNLGAERKLIEENSEALLHFDKGQAQYDCSGIELNSNAVHNNDRIMSCSHDSTRSNEEGRSQNHNDFMFPSPRLHNFMIGNELVTQEYLLRLIHDLKE